MSGDAKVIKMEPGMSVRTKRKGHERVVCKHMIVNADEATRMIVCENCDQVIEPFDFLWSWACREALLRSKHNRLAYKIDELEQIVEDLLRQERNTKARIKRAAIRGSDDDK